jgi:syntaxin 5
MHATKDFKTVLEIRSIKMKDQQIRKQELTGKGTLSPMRQFNASQQGQGVQQIHNQQLGLTKRVGGPSLEPSQGARIIPSPYNQNFENAYPHSNDEAGMPLLGREQGLLLAPPQASQYYEAREEAVTEVEKTINELGTLFKRLATMISEQQELVERIDDDIESSVNNAERAKSVLMKAYEQAVSNRGLTTKLAAILGGFILFFILFLM